MRCWGGGGCSACVSRDFIVPGRRLDGVYDRDGGVERVGSEVVVQYFEQSVFSG